MVAAAKHSEVARAQLDAAPDLPHRLTYLWDWFIELNAGRASNGFGVSAIPWAEFQAWAALTGRVLSAWELDCLRSVDRVFCEVYGASDKPKK